MAVMTVRGAVEAEALGVTLPHEHLFLDLRNQFVEFGDPEARARSREPVAMRNLGWLRRNPYALRDNLLLDDLATAAAEMEAYRAAGGRTVVDCTSVGIARQPQKLRAVAERTGLHVIAGCGYYTADTHPHDMDERSETALAGEMIRDLTEGIDGTGIRAGVIGEIGVSDPVHPNERKVLRAAAAACRATGAGIQVHTYPWGRAGSEAAAILLGAGVSPGKIVICHTDVEPDIAYMKELLARGVFVEFDDFGKEFPIDPEERAFAGGRFVRDEERAAVLGELLEAGFAGQILLTNDICLKCMLRAYGGWGYAHLLVHIVPMLRAAGVDRATLDRLLVENPARFLDAQS